MNKNHKDVRLKIASDCESDAKNLDGQPFDGKSVATQLGNQLAMIQAIALAVAALSDKN